MTDRDMNKVAYKLQQACAAISSQCDGARDQDGVGFNKPDAYVGNLIAQVPANQWTLETCQMVSDMLGKYSAQLSGLGISELPEVPQVQYDRTQTSQRLKVQVEGIQYNQKLNEFYQGQRTPQELRAANSEVYCGSIQGEWFQLFSPRNSDLITDIKAIQPWQLRKWNRDFMCWEVAYQGLGAKARNLLLDIINNYGFIVSDADMEILEQPTEVEKVESKTEHVWIEDEKIIFKVPFDRNAISDIKANLTGRRFNGTDKTWNCPASPENLQEAINLSVSYGWNLSKDFKVEAKETIQEAEENIEASQAVEADLEIPGLAPEYDLYPFQKAGVQYALKARKVLIGDEMGLGKALNVNAKLLTPTGWIRMGDVKLGDRLVDPETGKACTVTGVYPQGVKDEYEVLTKDGGRVECCIDHLWRVQTPMDRWNHKFRVVSTADMMGFEKTGHGKGQNRFLLPEITPVEWNIKAELPLDPYLVGVLLGDGSFRANTPSLSNPDEHIINKVRKLLPEGVYLDQCLDNPISYRMTTRIRNEKNLVTQFARKYDLDGKYSVEKHIPELYLRASIEDRMELLRGLMDTDGDKAYASTCIFNTSSEQLAKDVLELARSLGCLASISYIKDNPEYHHKGELRTGQRAYRLNIRSKYFCPYSLPYKMKNWEPASLGRAIVSVRPTGRKVEMQCISVNSASRTFITNDYIPTHNTLQGSATVVAANAFPCLVICPKAVKTQWVKEINKFFPNQTAAAFNNGKTNWDVNFLVINYDILKRNLESLKKVSWKAVIIDESHYIKNSKTQRSQAVMELVEMESVEYRIALTGTPVLNKPIELVPQLNYLDRMDSLFGGFWTFATKYCAAVQTTYGWDMNGAANLDELAKTLRRSCFVRREKKEVFKELPALQRTEIECSISKSAVNKFKKDLKATAAKFKERTDESARAEAMVEIMRLKRVAAQMKYNSGLEWVKNFLESGEKLVLFAHHRDIQDHLFRDLQDFNPTRITGGDSSEKREQNVSKFWNDDSCKVIICSIKAANVGVNLQKASNVAFFEFAWHSGDMDQAEARVHRIGSEASSINSYWLVGEGTFDPVLVGIIEAKREIADAVNQGVQPNKKLLKLAKLDALSFFKEFGNL